MSVADMPLAEGVEVMRNDSPPGCACIGGPRCCVLVYRQAAALQRAAHVVAKQLADLRDRDGYKEEWSA